MVRHPFCKQPQNGRPTIFPKLRALYLINTEKNKMNKSLVLIVASVLSFSSFAKADENEKTNEFSKCVSVWGPNVLEIGDLDPSKKIDKDDVFVIPKGWIPVSNSSPTGAQTIILLCK